MTEPTFLGANPPLNRPEDQPRFTDEIDQVIPKPQDDELNTTYGVGAALPFATPWVDDTWEVLRHWEENAPSVAQLVAMRRTDGQARALYRLITLPIRSALRTATFVPAEDGDKESEFIDQMFNLPPSGGGMKVPFSKFMAQLLTAVFDGFSAFEQVYWRPDNGPLKGKYTLKKLAYRPSETVNFLIDKNGNFEGLRQQTSYLGEVVDKRIPKRESFYWACQEEERDFYGVSLFESAFMHYDKKLRLYYIAHLAAQRQAVGTRVGEFPLGAPTSEKNRFAKSLADLGVAQWMMHPAGYKVENLTEQGSFDFLSYINHHNSQMSKSVLASFFDKDQGGGQGDAKLVDFSSQSDDLFIQMLEALMSEIADAINHYIIPKFIDWNFASGKYPTFQFGTVTDEAKTAIRETFEKLATAGQQVNVTPEMIFELEKKMAKEMKLEIDYDAIEAERKAQEEAANQVPLDGSEAGFGPPQDVPDPMAGLGQLAPAEPGAAPVAPPVALSGVPVIPLSFDGELDIGMLARDLLLELRHDGS